MAAREAYKTMLETTRQEPAQGPSGSAEGGPPASPTTEEPHYSECWGGSESGPSVLRVFLDFDSKVPVLGTG